MDGKSIMGILLLAAATGIGADRVGGRRRRAGGDRRAVRLHRNRIRRGHVQRLSGIGVSPGIGAGRAVLLIQRAQVFRFSISSSRDRRKSRGSTTARRRRPSSSDRIQRSAAGPRSRRAVRSAAPDARRSDAAAARGVHHRGAARQRRVGAAAGRSIISARSSTRLKIRIFASARATWRTSSAGSA